MTDRMTEADRTNPWYPYPEPPATCEDVVRQHFGGALDARQVQAIADVLRRLGVWEQMRYLLAAYSPGPKYLFRDHRNKVWRMLVTDHPVIDRQVSDITQPASLDRLPTRKSRSGLSLIELLFALAVILICVSLYFKLIPTLIQWADNLIPKQSEKQGYRNLPVILKKP